MVTVWVRHLLGLGVLVSLFSMPDSISLPYSLTVRISLSAWLIAWCFLNISSALLGAALLMSNWVEQELNEFVRGLSRLFIEMFLFSTAVVFSTAYLFPEFRPFENENLMASFGHHAISAFLLFIDLMLQLLRKETAGRPATS